MGHRISSPYDKHIEFQKFVHQHMVFDGTCRNSFEGLDSIYTKGMGMDSLCTNLHVPILAKAKPYDFEHYLNEMSTDFIKVRSFLEVKSMEVQFSKDIAEKIKIVGEKFDNELVHLSFDIQKDQVVIVSVIQDNKYSYELEHKLEERLFLLLYEFCTFKDYTIELKTMTEAESKVKTDQVVS